MSKRSLMHPGVDMVHYRMGIGTSSLQVNITAEKTPPTA